jgi:hypothetical protein
MSSTYLILFYFLLFWERQGAEEPNVYLVLIFLDVSVPRLLTLLPF